MADNIDSTIAIAKTLRIIVSFSCNGMSDYAIRSNSDQSLETADDLPEQRTTGANMVTLGDLDCQGQAVVDLLEEDSFVNIHSNSLERLLGT